MIKHKHRYVCADCGAVKQTVKRGKGIVHDQYCYCRMADHNCVELRKSEAMAETMRMIADGRLSPTWKRARKPAKVKDKPLESVESIKKRLSVCACGHPASDHDVDELGNLLFCCAIADAVGDNAPVCCECDHFHYDARAAA